MKSYSQILGDARKRSRRILDSARREARQELQSGLALCKDEQLVLFKRIYAEGDLQLSIGEIVDGMNEGQVECAMQQVQRTLEKNAKSVP